MRLFVGVELDAEVRASAAAVGRSLRAHLPRVVVARWIREENLHITLQFLGEVDDVRAPAVVAAVDSPFTLPAFPIVIGGLGAFPPSGSPRVFWLGVARGGGALAALHDEVADRMEPLGFPRERRRYAGHLTIARIKHPGPRSAHQAVRRSLAELPAHIGESQISAVTLFRSRLSPKGASYDAVLRVPLTR